MRLRYLLFVLLMTAATTANACGPDSDCMVGERHYRIALPAGYAAYTPVGALFYAHGYRGTAKGTMRNKSLRKMASDMGLALVALKSADEDWVIPGAPRHGNADGAAEFAYVDAVLRDVTQRFAVDDRRVMVSGFSAGGMLVWNLACAMPRRFAGFVAMSGTFWRGPPESCRAPVASVVHIHGMSDPVVPLAGREIVDTRQGDVHEVLDMYRAFGGFGPAQKQTEGRLTCDSHSNDQGKLLQLCLFDGGHSFRTEFLRYGWERLASAGRF